MMFALGTTMAAWVVRGLWGYKDWNFGALIKLVDVRWKGSLILLALLFLRPLREAFKRVKSAKIGPAEMELHTPDTVPEKDVKTITRVTP
jgi:hypothetical protein